MLVCDDVQTDPANPHKVNVFGLIGTIRSVADPPFPLCHPQLCVYLVLTGGRGTGETTVAVVQADSDRLVFASLPHTLSFGTDPLAVRGLVFRILNGVFPEAGLYWVEFRYNG
jgi:hypothetical protein